MLAVAVGLTLAAALAGALLGDATLLGGDVINWLSGRAGPGVSFVLETRMPRVLVALLAGTALAVAGTMIQAVCRNPLAEPGIIGVSGGAGLGAVLAITLMPLAGTWLIAGCALFGATLSSGLVFGLAARGGLQSDRLLLVGVGVSFGSAAVISFTIVLTDPFNAIKALTWLAGSTYGQSLDQLIPLVLALLFTFPLLIRCRRDLDLMALDDAPPGCSASGWCRRGCCCWAQQPH